MISTNISFKPFKIKKNYSNILKIKKDFKILLKEDNAVLKSLSPSYKKSYNKKVLSKYKKYSFRIIGMGGSILGAKAIYDFLINKIKKSFHFVDNLRLQKKLNSSKKKIVNLIVSKSGNTLETIANINVLVKEKDKNIFITENKKSYLFSLAEKLKAEIVYHNNFIGGRYSVLSEVGMLPAELMGLDIKKFKQMNSLIKNKKFINLLVENVSNTIYFLKKKKIQFCDFKL